MLRCNCEVNIKPGRIDHASQGAALNVGYLCDGAAMPNTCWFTGAQVNYAQQVLRHVVVADAAGLPAFLSHNEGSLGNSPAHQMSWPELRRQVASLALHLQAQGVLAGDRVAAYLPNSPETMVAFLATVSIGAV